MDFNDTVGFGISGCDIVVMVQKAEKILDQRLL
jgi:hypothetical protein